MARYGDLDALKENIASFAGMFTDEGFMIDYHAVLNAIKTAPAADVVEVVRCKNCVHGELASFEKQINKEASPERCYCNAHKCIFSLDYFCGHGKVKE